MLVEQELGHNPFDGALYAFTKRRRNKIKCLLWEDNGFIRFLQADETRIQVLKEDGKAAQSQKWMWVTRGGPPDRPSLLFAYDPGRSGAVAGRLLDGFTGILQVDGYTG